MNNGKIKTLKFRHKLTEEILAGRKTVTWRLFDDKDLKNGDILELIDWESGEKFADATIVSLYEKKLGDVVEKDYDGHEKYMNQAEMLETYKKYYGDKVSLDTSVKIIKFEVKNGKKN